MSLFLSQSMMDSWAIILHDLIWEKKLKLKYTNILVNIYNPRRNQIWAQTGLIKKDGSEAVRWVGPVRAGLYRFPHSFYTPCDPTRRMPGTLHRRRTSGSRGTWPVPSRCNWGTSGTARPWASGPWRTWRGPPRPARSDPSPAESTRSDSCSIYRTTERSEVLEETRGSGRERFFWVVIVWSF